MKAQDIKSAVSIFILYFTFSFHTEAQNFTQSDITFTPPGYPEGPLLGVLFIPSNPNGVGVITAHTGGGDRHQLHLWDSTLAANGYVVLDIDYYDLLQNIYPSRYPAPPRALKTAAEFLRKNSFQFGCYTSMIAGLGQSNGAMALGETITWDNDDGFFQTNPEINDHFDAAILYYSMYDNKNYLTSIFDLKNLVKNYFHDYPSLQFRKGNPIDNISNITTPMLMFHGTADDAIQVEQSITFHDACIAAGKSNELIIFPGQPHSYDYPPDPVTFRNRNLFNVLGLISRDSVLAFLQRTVSPYSNKCSNTLTYWKNNITQWSMYSLPMMLGTSSYYNATQLLSLMNAVPGNDMSLRLAQHLITAKLNAMNGANASQVLSAIIEADNLIGTRTLPIVPTIIQGSQEGGQMNSLINTLESFNNGNGNVNCVARIAEPVGDTREEQMVKVFPNPLSNGSAISFSLTQSEKVLLEIYDMNGKLILTVANRIFDLGNHLIELDTDRMNPGIYVLHAKMKEDSSYQELIMNK